MKRRMRGAIGVISLVLALATLLGGSAFAATMPTRHADFHSEGAQTHKTVYKVAPADNLDGFGEKDRVGMKLHIDGTWIYLDTYEFHAGDKRLGIYTPTVTDIPIFRAFGVASATGKEINLLPATASDNISFKYSGETDGALVVDAFKSSYQEYQSDDLFMATPSKTAKLVIAFRAPKDGIYSFSETVVKRESSAGIPKKYAGVTYSVVKSGSSEPVLTLTSERTEKNETDSLKYTLDGSVELKKDDDLFFIMEVASENEAERGFTSRLKELKLTCGGDTYNLTEYPDNAGASTARGYADGDKVYFKYESVLSKDENQKKSDAFSMQAHDKNAVLVFVAPRSGTFELSAKLTRVTDGESTVIFTRNGSTLSTHKIGRAEKTVTEKIVLDKDETVCLELVADGSGAVLYARSVSTAIKALETGELDPEYDGGDEKPLYTVAMMSDLHIDGKLPLRDVPLKQTIIDAINYIKDRGGADVILLGGDTLGEGIYHTDNKDKSAWNYENIVSTMTYLDAQLATATKTGRNVFYISGNHDKQPGVIAEYKERNVRIHSGSYTHYMLNRTGGYLDALYMADITGNPLLCRYPDEVLCYRYNVGGMDFIGINQAYTGNAQAFNEDTGAGQVMYPQQIIWLKEQLEEIGPEKTVMIFNHYNFSTDGTNYEYWAPSQYASLGDPREMLMELLEQYPNAIFNYGHIHWRVENESAWYNTSELIWNFGDKTLNDDGSYTTTGYHYVHMASICYSATRLDEGGKVDESTNVSQIMMVDFYADRITFEVVNVGKMENASGVREMTTYTVKRDMSQLDVYNGTEPTEDTSAFETMSSPGITTVRANRTTKPVSSEEAAKKDKNSLPVIIGSAVVAVAVAASVTVIIVVNRKKKKN